MSNASRRLWASTLLVGLFGLSLVQAAGAAEETKSSRSKTSKKSQANDSVQVSFRLPRYFASIIDEEQRAEIYQIQASYHEKISDLQEELAELQAEQLKAMEGLLTSTQRKTLDQMRDGSSKAESGKSGATKSKRASSSSKSSKSTKSGSSSRSKKSSADDD